MNASINAVFLSYASQDVAAARRIDEALRAAGVVVWFDESELRGGDAWDASIRKKIKECALFVPIISANTESRSEGYFRLEWKLAVDRSHLMADDQPFLLPVVIDDTSEVSARVPDRFRERQWSRLPAGENADVFAEHARSLLGSSEAVPATIAPSAVRAKAAAIAGKSRFFKGLVAALAAVIVALIAAVRLQTDVKDPASVAVRQSTPTETTARQAPKADQNTVAVLPFTNLSDDKANEYFSDGISEELLSVLQKIAGLRVAARLSAFSFKGTNATTQEIGEKLGVAHLVEGSVRKAGQSVRITVRLSRAATGEQLWSDSYTRDLQDVFAVQSEVAQTIVEQLRVQLGGTLNASAKAAIQAQVRSAGKGGTKNADAYQRYLQGIYFLNQFTRDSAIRAADFLERAVEADPGFALAWAALSQASSVRGGFADTKPEFDEGFAVARRAAGHALELEPDLSEAHLARMRVQMWYDFDWRGATESLKHAQKSAPTDPDVLSAAAQLAYTLGQREKAVEFARQAVASDPVNAEMRMNLAFALESAGRYDDAVSQFRRTIELSPTNPWGHAGVALMLLRQGRFDDALREAERESNEWSRLTAQAQVLWALEKKAESDAVLARLTTRFADTAAYQIAEVHAYRRENDRAFEWLERALRQHDPGLTWSRLDLSLARLQDDPRWLVFLNKVGLADEQLK